MVLPQIEHANIVNLDWALAHMDVVRSKKARRKSGTTEDWVYEAEMKDTVEDVSDVPCTSPILKRYAPSTAGRSQGTWRPAFGRQYVPL